MRAGGTACPCERPGPPASLSSVVGRHHAHDTDEAQAEQLHALEHEVDELLERIAASQELASSESLARLEHLAGAAAKLAYGTGHPEWIPAQMRDLIAWTDHLDDPSWVERFQQALSRRPLASPWRP
jgi:hypothetical protein